MVRLKRKDEGRRWCVVVHVKTDSNEGGINKHESNQKSASVRPKEGRNTSGKERQMCFFGEKEFYSGVVEGFVAGGSKIETT